MSGFIDSDGSALVGGQLPSSVGQALQLDAVGNLKTTSAGGGTGNVDVTDRLARLMGAVKVVDFTGAFTFNIDSSGRGLVNISQINGVSPVIDASGSQGVTIGGKQTTAIASAGSANVKASPGRLFRVLITAAGTASLTFYDNAAGGATGTIIGVTPPATTVGQIYDFQLPAAVGISAVGGAGTPGVTVSWT